MVIATRSDWTAEDVKALRARVSEVEGKHVGQESFAHMLGVTFSTVSRWENGHTTPYRHIVPKLDRLAKRYNFELS